MDSSTQRNQIIGSVLIVLGGLLWLARASNLNFGEIFWPFFILLPGAALITVAFNNSKRSDLAVPGSLLTTLGLIFLFQSITGYFESWAYVWALIPTSVGVGRALQGSLSGDRDKAQKGEREARNGLITLAIFFVFFEVIIGLGGRGIFDNLLFPLLLIGTGAYLLSRQQKDDQTEDATAMSDSPSLTASSQGTSSSQDAPSSQDTPHGGAGSEPSS